MSVTTPGVFWARFTDHDEIGRDITDLEQTTFYATTKNGKQQVGEARKNIRTNHTIYSIIDGELADMIVYWYTIRPVRESYAEMVSTIQTAHTLCQVAVDKGCALSGLLDARDHLSCVLKSLQSGKVPGKK